MNYRDLFEYPGSPECPELTTERIAMAEDVLGVQLPFAYLELIRACNGGKLKCNTFYLANEPLATLCEPLVQIPDIMGIGGEYGVDARYGSDYLIEEWNYPKPGVVLWSGGQQAIMLDYRDCARDGEPPVIWVDMDAHESDRTMVLADSFQNFIEKLVEAPPEK